MNEKEELLKKLEEILIWKKSKAFYAEKLGITEEQVDNLLKELRKQETHERLEDLKTLETTKFTEDIKNGEAELTFRSYTEVHNLDELILQAKIDTDKWDIDRYVQNYWGNSENPHYQVKVWLTKKKKESYGLEHFTEFLKNYKIEKHPCSCKPLINNELETVDIELNIADFHLAKRTFQKDTLETKEFDYYKAVNDLVTKVKRAYNINKIVFPIGNDMFHTDNYQNSTTAGTPQDVTAWYDEEYEKGFDVLANSINYLITQAKEVEVVLVQGNHDRTKGFFVAHALEVFFKGYKNIKFQRHASVIKHTVLGNTFIGYHHGDHCKLDDLPLLFATGEFSKEFGNAKYREIHTGDKHFYLAKEVKGVRIQQMPSLSGTDRWHRENNYVNQIRAALVLVYHPEKGKVCEFEERI